VAAAKAKIDQALADQKAAEANIAVMQAKLKKAQAIVGYMSIVSPYTGVVTHRSYFVGDFIRSASDGNTKPLFTVARTDLMRVVTKISDLDVPYVDVGDPAIVTIQALPGLKLPGKVSRFTESEIPNERTMSTEIDIPNDEKSPAHGRLRDGMYGEALIILNPPSDHLTLPSSCLIGPAKEYDNRVLVVKDGHATAVKVKTGTDDGIHVEILSGVTLKDQVIIPDGEVADGTPVIPLASVSKESKSSH
jgi:HlyD family secretion protein